MRIPEIMIITLIILSLLTQGFIVYILLYIVGENKNIALDVQDINRTLNMWELTE